MRGRPKTVETKEEGKFSMTCNLMPLWNSKSISSQFLSSNHTLSNIAAIKVSSIMSHEQETDLGNDLRPRWREIKWLYGVESGETILVGHNTEDHEHGERNASEKGRKEQTNFRYFYFRFRETWVDDNHLGKLEILGIHRPNLLN